MQIQIDKPTAALPLLREHLADVALHSPPGSIHALDIESTCSANITFWTATDGPKLLGCGALLELDPTDAPTYGEIKSMRTAREHLRKGVASAILRAIIEEARRRKYTRVSLETGSQDYFAPARTLYTSFGFTSCGPFAEYVLDPSSVFMTRAV